MWILRFLNGPMAGQIVPLSKSSTLLGRSPSCDIKIPSGNVSKEHTRIEIYDDKLIVSDTGSRNGTFINGVQIRSSKAKSGDKIGIHDVLIEVQNVPENWAARFQAGGMAAGYDPRAQAAANDAYQLPPARRRRSSSRHEHEDEDFNSSSGSSSGSGSPVQDLLQGKLPRFMELARQYMERVVLPGVYNLPQIFEFKWVLAGLMAVFILLVTALSTIPLIRILKNSIEEESQHHAMTIATTLARVNIPALQQGIDSSVSVEIAVSRPGVTKAFVISNIDGSVISPAAQAGTTPELPYVHEGRKLDHESVKQVNDSTIVAMVPVRFYNSDTGSQAVTAWAVVFFDMASLAVDNAQVISLFISTLFISMLLGFILFYFLYKMIEHPIKSMNQQLDVALKEGHETVQIPHLFPAMQTLANNVSSALTRALNGSGDAPMNRALEHDRNREIGNLVELIGFAAMGIRASDLSIAAANQAYEQRVGVPASQLTSLTVNEISDQALKLSVKDLIERVDKSPDDIAANDLEFAGNNFQVVAQAVFGTNAIAYYLIVLLPKDGGG